MRKIILAAIAAAVVLGACGQQAPEPVTVLSKPYNVETAKEAAQKAAEPLPDARERAVTVFKVAEATVVTPEPENAIQSVSEPENVTQDAEPEPPTEPEPMPEEPQEPVELQSVEYTDIETGEELPPPADSFTEAEMIPLGVMHICHYSAEAMGNAIGARGRTGGMVEGESIAMPEYWMLGCTVLVEGYGFYTVDDISPDGVADIFHWYEADAIGDDYREVYIVVEG